MVDTRAVAHEVQEQFLAAVQRGQQQFRRGQEQLRKSQDQLRKSQEQFRKGREAQLRKGREAVSTAIRTGNELAKAVRPNIPARSAKGLHVPQVGALPSPAKLRAHAQEFAGQVAATQRHLADRAVQVASPLVADGVARLNHVVSSLWEDRQDHAEPLAPAAVAGTDKQPTGASSKPSAEAEPQASAHKPAGARTAQAKTGSPTGPTKPARARTTPAKTATAKTTPAKAAPAKTAPAKTAPAKTAPAKTAPAKAAPAKAKTTSTAKPRATKAKS
jgi:hypothetical protein